VPRRIGTCESNRREHDNLTTVTNIIVDPDLLKTGVRRDTSQSNQISNRILIG
jgi:hypothetical protein